MGKRVAIVGMGVVGTAYAKMFPDAVMYDPPREEREASDTSIKEYKKFKSATKEEVNSCDVALVSVFTPLVDGKLDTSIVESVIDWLDTKLIIIKSALYPGTTDKLVEKTGKRIAVSVEYIGEGNYPIHFWKYPHPQDPRRHMMLVVGGAEDVAEEACQVLWRKLSPDVKIHKVTALEAEIVKLVENSYGALKVTFANTFLSLAEKSGSSFIRMHQAWNSDPRTDSMHVRAVSHDRGWVSKCWDKDVPALANYASEIGADDTAELFNTIIELNEIHVRMNDGS